MITLDGTKHIKAISDETSEQVTRWAAALEGYRKEQRASWDTPMVIKYVIIMLGRIIFRLDIEDTMVNKFKYRTFRNK